METSSKSEMEKVLKPHAPHYNGNEFFPDKYNVLEEELICWSETSLKSPLNDAGNKRYMQLFSEVFPEDYARLQKMVRWTMENKLSYEKLFEIAWNAIQEMEYSEYEHGAILDYLNITEEQYQFIKESVEAE